MNTYFDSYNENIYFLRKPAKPNEYEQCPPLTLGLVNISWQRFPKLFRPFYNPDSILWFSYLPKHVIYFGNHEFSNQKFGLVFLQSRHKHTINLLWEVCASIRGKREDCNREGGSKGRREGRERDWETENEKIQSWVEKKLCESITN